MQNVVQNYRTGTLAVTENPVPQIREGSVLVQTQFSIISAGTEKTKVDTAKKSLLGKAMARPDLVRQVINRAKKEGLLRTWQVVSDRLNAPTPLGYSCSGRIIETQGDVGDLRVGDLVACAGSSANHAEIVSIPRNLAVRIPEGVSLDHAAFATLGAIAVQGVRQGSVQFGEKVAVIGLGLIGLMTIQILRAAGCRVLGIDIDPAKLKLARDLGCEATVHSHDEGLEEQVLLFTGGYGVDATIITAASSSNQPIELSGDITRERGRVVVVGLTKMDVPREPFYLKEIELRISRSYGPGRYDNDYEEKGRDYPFAYVRFTENRNMGCFLELLQGGQVRLDPLITHRFKFADATSAYALIGGERKEPYIGILLEYDRPLEKISRRLEFTPKKLSQEKLRIGIVGAGKYATTNLLPWISQHPGLAIGSICTATGITAVAVAQKFGGTSAESDANAVITGSDAVLIATRHDSHARYACEALLKGKPVYVEKPLALNDAELAQVRAALLSAPNASVMVGFNRRFAPASDLVRQHFKSVPTPLLINMRVNAGPIPADHWIQDPEVGGGRLVGEGCHFVDLAVALGGSPIRAVQAAAIPIAGTPPARWDNFSLQLELENGTLATIAYTSVGDPGLAKERIEVHGGGKSAVIDDFQVVELWSGRKCRREKSSTQDKGQRAEVDAWAAGLKAGTAPIPWPQLESIHRACFAALRSMQSGERIVLQPPGA